MKKLVWLLLALVVCIVPAGAAAELPACFSSLISVDMPALNMITITPISERLLKKSVGWIRFRTPGPKIRPASKAPTTWGSCSFRVTRPNTLVLNRISATSNKNL